MGLATPQDPGRIHTASVAELAASSPSETLQEIQRRASRLNWFRAYLIAAGVALFAVVNIVVVFVPVLTASLIGGFFVYRWDRERRTARVIYDVDDQAMLYRFALCSAAGESLSRTAILWHVYSAVHTSDTKRNAGASSLIRRTPTRSALGSLPNIEVNLEPWAIPVGPQQLLFLPDRLIVREGSRFAAVPYEHLSALYQPTRFVEDDSVPRDTQVVDTTWQYVNKSGGPDRRFNDNRQLPVVCYGELVLRSPTGITIVLQSSNPVAAERAAYLLDRLIQHARQPSQPAVASEAAEPGHSVPDVRPVTPRPSRSPGLPVISPGVEQDRRAVLQSVAIVLRYISAADRRISDDEVAFASDAITELARGDQVLSAEVIGQFRTLKSNAAAVRDAIHTLRTYAPTIIPRVVEIAETLAGADGKTTPKERERIYEVRTWAAG